MFQFIEIYQHLPLALIVFSALLSLMSVCHIALRVTNPNRAAGWAAFTLFMPFLGPLAYWALGINRFHRKARKIYPHAKKTENSYLTAEFELPKDKKYFSQMISLVNQVTQRPLQSGNIVEPLVNGDIAYPSMLKSIRSSCNTISLSASLVNALAVAAMRGVKVQIITPEAPDVTLVSWARSKILKELIDKNCEIYFTQSPFDHSKMFVVDGYWTLVTSANWDSRSLRLNFEVALECYDKTFAGNNIKIFNKKLMNSYRLSGDYFEKLSLAKRLRNGFANFLTPYL